MSDIETPPRKQLLALFNQHYRDLRKELPDSIKENLNKVDSRYATLKDDVEIDEDFFRWFFLNPSTVENIQLATMKLMFAVEDVLEKKGQKRLKMAGFFVAQSFGVGLGSTRVVTLPIGSGVRSRLKTQEDPNRQAVMDVFGVVGTGEPLIPTSIVELDNGFSGDLYIFRVMRSLREQSIAKGERGSFARFPVHLRMKVDFSDPGGRVSTQLLFLRETKPLEFLTEEGYRNLLRANSEPLSAAQSGEEACEVLKSIGFKAVYFRTEVDFIRYPYFSPIEGSSVITQLLS